MSPALVILAAGESRRLGQCKALVELGGRSVLERLLAAARGRFEGPPLIVTGTDHDAILRAAPAGCEVVHNPRWREGRSTGVLLALEHRPGRDLILAPVDVPLVPAAVFSALAREWEILGSPPLGWLAPRFEPGPGPGHPGAGKAPWPVPEPVPGSSRYGHPLVAGRDLVAELERRPPDTPLSVLRELARPLSSVPVPHREILDDLDETQDLEDLRRRLSDSSVHDSPSDSR